MPDWADWNTTEAIAPLKKLEVYFYWQECDSKLKNYVRRLELNDSIDRVNKKMETLTHIVKNSVLLTQTLC